MTERDCQTSCVEDRTAVGGLGEPRWLGISGPGVGRFVPVEIDFCFGGERGDAPLLVTELRGGCDD